MKKIRTLYSKYRSVSEFLRPMEIALHSAHTGFFFIMSLFPILMLIFGILQHTDYSLQDLMLLLERFVPQSLMPSVEYLIENLYRHSTGATISISTLATLWSASRGTYSLLMGFNAVYGIEDNRSYLRKRSVSVVYTFLLLVTLTITVMIYVLGNTIADYLWMTTRPAVMFLLNVFDLSFFLPLLLQTLLFTIMYALHPGQIHHLPSCLPGALLASFGWTAYTRLFSIYVDYFCTYTNIYGSVYMLVLGMLWLYFCICILFYGGALNRWIAEHRSK